MKEMDNTTQKVKNTLVKYEEVKRDRSHTLLLCFGLI